VTGDQITPDAILDGAAAICPAEHRHRGQATEPPCGDCYAAAEAVLRAAWPRLVHDTGGHIHNLD
jgi:hypothetical protein